LRNLRAARHRGGAARTQRCDAPDQPLDAIDLQPADGAVLLKLCTRRKQARAGVEQLHPAGVRRVGRLAGGGGEGGGAEKGRGGRGGAPANLGTDVLGDLELLRSGEVFGGDGATVAPVQPEHLLLQARPRSRASLGLGFRERGVAQRVQQRSGRLHAPGAPTGHGPSRNQQLPVRSAAPGLSMSLAVRAPRGNINIVLARSDLALSR
jgi:hypothetical protein